MKRSNWNTRERSDSRIGPFTSDFTPAMNRSRSWQLAFLLAIAQQLSAADPEVDPQDLPRTPPTPVEQIQPTFAVKQGFHLEVTAAEPLVRDPIEICFDENGHLFVVEMIDYSERRGETPHLGQIRMLEDADADGRYDRSHVFADDLPWPSAVFCWDGGLFVAATPDIVYLKDTDSDGRADQREIVFTGFASDYAPYATNQLNVQAMLNSFRWGLDNRIHGVTSMNGGKVRPASSPDAPPLNLRGRDFAFDPRSRELSAEAGGGQYGMSFDDAGARFTCSNSDHIRVFMYDTRYAARNPAARLPGALQSIAVDGPSAEVYRRSPDEPWRVIRTRWRVSGVVPGIVEGGGRPSGYFTSATGLTVYRGDAFPEEFRGDVFIADCGSNLIHRKKVRRDGVAYLAERPIDEQTTEFLTSTDLWFRPVQLANAPDGTLWLIDMYREIIEHPWSLPPTLKKHLDLNAGNDRGRLLRVVPDDFQQRPQPQLGQATTEQLVTVLGHPNAWHRETASRLLYERQDQASAVPALERLLANPPAPLAHLHALYALVGQGALKPAHAQAALASTDEHVRVHALKLAEQFLSDPGIDTFNWQQLLIQLTADPSPRVRFQLAFTLGELPPPHRLDPLEALIDRDLRDPWILSATLSSLGEGSPAMFERLAARWNGEWTTAPVDVRSAQSACLEQLAGVIGALATEEGVSTVLNLAQQTTHPKLALRLLQGLAEGRPRSAPPLPAAKIAPLLAQALKVAVDSSATEGDRVRAITLLGQAPFSDIHRPVLDLLHPKESTTVQLAALATLSRFADPAVGPAVTERWATLTPRVRSDALSLLLARPDRALALLEAVKEDRIRPTELDSNQIRFLVTHREAAVQRLAGEILTTAPDTERAEVLEFYQPALALAGVAERGRTIFTERCASCHRLAGEGYNVGPELVSVRNAGRAKMLMNIVDPSQELLPQYVAYEIEIVDGESLLGILTEETAISVNLRQAYGTETRLQRSDIASITSIRKSIMSDGLESGLDHQAMADLFEFIFTAE
jgi:putative membrane-bound dehydrogenase-like protein